MSTSYQPRRAEAVDLPQIMELLRARVRWLRDERRSDQWEDVANWETLLRYLIRRGQTWVLDDDAGRVIATITISRDPDREFWTADECKERALYVSKLATDPSHAGEGLGARMLQFAVDRARDDGAGVVRLDVWRTADRLHRYYKELGWEHIRTAPGSRRSGELFDHQVPPPDTAPLPLDDLRALLAVDDRRPAARDRWLLRLVGMQ